MMTSVDSPPDVRRGRRRIDRSTRHRQPGDRRRARAHRLGRASGVTGDDVERASRLPSSASPPCPTPCRCVAQSQVVVDLEEGYEGRLTIDDVAFPTMRMEDLTNDAVEPGEQVDIPAGVVFEPGNDTLTFTPGPGIDIEAFDDGVHRVTVVYWPAERGDAAARSYSWSFNVV